ncbi:P-loop NTPase fold protein [Rhodococcus cerastii]|uniref:P-loop NTPase fold protein n=1 Tax=Rhodococcus cerastii TaxID=908616 RepID=A0ABU4D2V0_9NOCA|nr:P-loop NTPase fold protein [Rhodococcus cerastii]MDV6303677.1 P-loop NTPase fold protein [Rhodococcus cerastii]
MTPQDWTDEPITTDAADKFARGSHAARVAQLIAGTHSWTSSTVFGLTGAWGSGKTSLINLVEDALDALAADYAVVWFTPWATQNVNGLLDEFYSALTTALPTDRRKNARRVLATLLRIAAPAATAIPVGGGVTAEAANSAAEALIAEKPWQEAFSDAAAQIFGNGQRVLVVVDDVDRLQGNELLAVLKVVRLLGRFPGVQYLLAYDHESLVHTLVTAGATQNPAAARRYIEKMVQYPVAIPALIGAQIQTLLNEQLEDVLRRHRPNSSASLDIVRGLSSTMRATLTTPRAIGRYIAQLDYEFGMHLDGETDIEDVVILALLRTAFPEIHHRLPQFQHELVTGHNHVPGDSRTTSSEYFSTDRLLDGLEFSEKTHATAMLETLFPKLRDDAAIIRRQGVAQGNYFGRYFAMTILDAYDVPDSKVNRAIYKAFTGAGESLVGLLQSEDPILALLAVEKAQNAFTQALADNATPVDIDASCLSLLEVVVPILDTLGASGRFTLTLQDVTTNWIGADVVPAISGEADPAPIIRVLERAPSTRRRLALLSAARGSLTLRGQQWWPSVLEATLPAVLSEFLANLSEQDHANEDPRELIEFFYAVRGAGVNLAPLRDGVEDAITAGKFEIDHLASRFINPSGPGQFSADQNGFDVVAPRTDYGWYSRPQEEFTTDVTSWKGRREMAAGRIVRPAE